MIRWIRCEEHETMFTFKTVDGSATMKVRLDFMGRDRAAVELDLVERLKCWPHPECYHDFEWDESTEEWRKESWERLVSKRRNQ